MNFQSVEEVQNKAEMTRSLKWLMRIRRPANFLFKHECERLDKQPLLLLASPGRKVDRSLAQELKSGGRPVWGQVRRKGRKLTFITRGRANKNLMTRKLLALGSTHSVPLKRKDILILTDAEGRAVMAIERSVQKVARVRKPTEFVFKGRVDALGGGSALLLSNSKRYARSLGGGGLIEGMVNRVNGSTLFTVTKGSVSPGQMVALLKKLGKEHGTNIRNPKVVIGEGGVASQEDMTATEPSSGPAKAAKSGTAKVKSGTAKAVKPSQESSSGDSKAAQASSLEETRRKIAEAQKRAEAARQKAREDAERAEQERIAREKAENERRENERREREAREQARQNAEELRLIETLPKLESRHERAQTEAEEAQAELSKALTAWEREQKVFSKKNLRRFDEVEELIDALVALQNASEDEDKELRELMRDLQREDDIDDAVDECMEWFEERSEDMDDELGELRKEVETLTSKVSGLSEEIERIKQIKAARGL